MYALGGNKELGNNPLWEHIQKTKKLLKPTLGEKSSGSGGLQDLTQERRVGDIVAHLGGPEAVLPQASNGVEASEGQGAVIDLEPDQEEALPLSQGHSKAPLPEAPSSEPSVLGDPE